jgi:hypothetical protein
MSTELERRLREELHQDAERAVLLNPDAPPVPETRPLSDGPEPRRPARKIVAVAAAIALVAAVGVAVTRDRDRDREPDVTTHDPMVDAFEDLVVGEVELYTDVAPGSTVELPPPPIAPRQVPTTVWTGDELIVWAGMDAEQQTLDDGAAFDLESGTWRTIAPAPIDPRLYAPVAWTGSEMIVWGGQRAYSGSGSELADFILTDGAAYDPATDTWRSLGELPAGWTGVTAVVWADDELLVLNEDRMAAFDPATGEWRPLSAPPPNVNWFPSAPLWTGEVLLTTMSSVNQTTGNTDSTWLVRYDPEVDLWKGMGELTTDPNVFPELVPITDAEGGVRAVLAEPIGIGAPVVVFDRTGTKIGTLPAVPFDPAEEGGLSAATLWWAGEEVLASSTAFASPGTPGDVSEPWALDPATQVWRALEPDQLPPKGVDLALVTDAGVLIGWGPLDPEQPASSTGLLYRPPTPAEG